MQIIESRIEIHAPKKLVWDVLIDFEQYHQWNPFTPKVVCDFKIGNPVELHVDMKQNGKTSIQKEELLWIKNEESIAWGITSYFPVRTERAQILQSLGSEKTSYYTYDKFWGILVPLVMWGYRTDIQKGFDAVGEGLKSHCEKLFQGY